MQRSTYESLNAAAQLYIAEGRAKGHEEGLQEGFKKGVATALLEVLDARGLAVDPLIRGEILACTELSRLKLRLREAMKVQSVRELWVYRGRYEYQSEFARKYVAQGLAKGREEGREEGLQKGEAAALLEVLDARGLVVSAEARKRIESCSELVQLKRWLRQAVTAKSVQELFGSAPSRKPARKAAPQRRSMKTIKPRSKR